MQTKKNYLKERSAFIRSKMKCKRHNYGTLAKVMGIDKQTLSRKVRDLSEFRESELDTLCRELEITAMEFAMYMNRRIDNEK